MARISVSSAKAKGRRLQQDVARRISELVGIPCGKDECIESRPMGQSGTDVRLSAEARALFPFSVETKASEAWDVPGAIRQAKANTYDGTDWLVVMKRSREAPVAIMDAEALFKILERLQRLKRTRTI